MSFFHDGEVVANIDVDGNLNIQGELFQEINIRELSVVHANKNMRIWPNPYVYYEGKRMTAFLVSDPTSNPPGHLSYAAFFWDEKNFYTWTSIITNMEGPHNHLMTVEPFNMNDGRVCAQLAIRGTVKTKQDKAQDAN